MHVGTEVPEKTNLDLESEFVGGSEHQLGLRDMETEKGAVAVLFTTIIIKHVRTLQQE
jgi:hypothetical protein